MLLLGDDHPVEDQLGVLGRVTPLSPPQCGLGEEAVFDKGQDYKLTASGKRSRHFRKGDIDFVFVISFFLLLNLGSSFKPSLLFGKRYLLDMNDLVSGTNVQ